MSAVTRCDSCQAERPSTRGPDVPAWHGWQHLITCRLRDDGDGEIAYDEYDFCSWKCLGEFVTARALIESAEDLS